MLLQDLLGADWDCIRKTHLKTFQSKYPHSEWEDVYQQTCLILWERYLGKDFDSFEHVLYYTLKIAKNLHINVSRKLGRFCSSDQVIEQGYVCDEVYYDLKRFDISDRMSLWLQGYTLSEIAEAKEVGISTVHKSISKEISQLQEHFV